MSSDPIEVLRHLAAMFESLEADYRAKIKGRDAADPMTNFNLGIAEGYERASKAAQAALASLSAPKPSGEWVLVPREPTQAMCDAAWKYGVGDEAPDPNYAYRAMLATAPKPESAEAVCPECHGEGGQRWHEADGSERGERCGTCDGFGTAPPRPEASESWHAALDSASELASNAPDDRYRKRAEQVRDWIRTHPAAPQQASAPVGVPVDVVREYLDARACYEAATRPPNSHARASVLKHDDPDARRLREARVALRNAIALARSLNTIESWNVQAQPAAVDEATRRDAERYRWLRANGKPAAEGLVMRDPSLWDAAIDLVLAGQQQGGTPE